MPRPLDGIRILDLTRLLPGGVCTMLLADLGADVIKVEDPNGGDYARWMPPLLNEMGAFFRSTNRNKRSIILDLKLQEGQTVFHKLVENADVLIESFRPGVMSRLQCDYPTLKALNPRIVYCSLSGWGQEGPYMDKSGHDLNYVSLTGLQGANRTPQPLGGQVADVGGAYVGVIGIFAALLKRTVTGEGDFVDVSLAESAMPFAMYAWVEAMMIGTGAGNGMLTGFLACYNVYQTKDGQSISLAALEPKFWSNFCQAVQRPDWVELHQNSGEQEALKQSVADLFASRPAADWNALLSEADCCFSLIVPPAEIVDDAHIHARKMVGVASDGMPWMRSPVRLASDEFSIGTVPGYGEHTREILHSVGYNDLAIDNLIQRNVVK